MYDLGDGYEAIAPSREMLPMDPGSERAIVSTPIDSRRVVALQVLRVSVEAAQIVSIFARDGIDLRCKRCQHLAKAPGQHDRPVVDAVRPAPHHIGLVLCPAELTLHVARASFPAFSRRASVAQEPYIVHIVHADEVKFASKQSRQSTINSSFTASVRRNVFTRETLFW